MSENNLDANKITEQAVKFFGNSSQLMIAQEECGELVAAISQYIRGRKDVYALVEEIADVEIMCMQLRHMVGSNIVDAEKNKKLVRLAERLGMNKMAFSGN